MHIHTHTLQCHFTINPRNVLGLSIQSQDEKSEEGKQQRHESPLSEIIFFSWIPIIL